MKLICLGCIYTRVTEVLSIIVNANDDDRYFFNFVSAVCFRRICQITFFKANVQGKEKSDEKQKSVNEVKFYDSVSNQVI